jgi:fumarate hydratase subunit beta
VKRVRTVKLPPDELALRSMRAGDHVLLSGTIYVARDASHRRMSEALDKGEELPFPLRGATIFYMGPAPAKPGRVIGSSGPTTSGRMDSYTPRFLAEGLKVMIGKGSRSEPVKKALQKYGAVYLAAIGGTAALIAKSIKKCDVIAYPELGAEAVLRLDIEDFPAVVVNDIYGGDLYEEGKAKYRRAVP